MRTQLLHSTQGVKNLLGIFLLVFLPIMLQAQTGCGIDYTSNSNSITLSGIDAPINIIKVFNPNWTINFECTGNCDATEVVGNLSPGTYHLTINTYTATWSPVCDYTTDIVVSGGGNPGNGINFTFCPADINLSPQPGNGQQVVMWNEPTATTDCGSGGLTITLDGFSPPSGTSLATGNYDIKYTATDACGNTATCAFTIEFPFWNASIAYENCPNNINLVATSSAGAVANWNDPTVLTDCPSGFTSSQTVGMPSGSVFPIGTSEITYNAYGVGVGNGCGVSTSCFFTVTVNEDDNNGGGDCDVTWTTTNSSITINGLNSGHVIFKLFNPNWSINTQCVDDCSDPLTISGLTTGATYHLAYNLYDSNWQPICDDVQDVVISGGGNPGGLPNLELADLVAPNSGAANSVVNFRVDIKNTGVATASGSYVLGWYLSDDAALSSNDTRVGEINTGNTPVGTQNNVPSAITIPPGFVAGDYWLIGNVDEDNNIAESDESNNTIRRAFEVTGGGGNPGGECGFLKEYGPFNANGDINLASCTATENSNNYVLTCTGRQNFSSPTNKRNVVLTLDKNGNQVSVTDDTEIIPAENPGPLFLEFTDEFDIVATKRDDNANLIWETTISYQSDVPAGVTLIGVSAFNIRQVNDGVLIFGTLVGSQNGNTIFYQSSTKLNNNGAVVQKNFISPAIIADFFNLSDPVIDNNTGYIFDVFEGGTLSLIKFGTTGEFLWRQIYAGDLPSNTKLQVTASADERFVYTLNRNNLKAILEKVDAETGASVYTLQLGSVLSASNDYSFEYPEGFLLTADGGVVVGHAYQIAGLFNDWYYEYGKLDANGNLLWENSFATPNVNGFGEAYGLEPVFQTADGGFLFAETNVDGNEEIRVMKVTSDGSLTPTCSGGGNPGNGTDLGCGVSYTMDNGTLRLTGSGLSSAHVIVKLFSPSWSTVFECTDNCDNEISIPNIGNGTYHLSVNTYNSSWSPVCDFLEDLNLTGAPRLTNEIAIDQHRSIILNNLYPVPANDYINIDFTAKEEVELVANIYDARGVLVAQKQVQLASGENTINWNISDLPTGFYQIIFDAGSAHAPIRFIKQQL